MTHISLNAAREKLLHNDGFFYTLLRSGISAQICGWIDMLVSFMLFALIHLTPWLSTALGAFTGGIFNCIINYRYAFHAHNKNVSRRAVTVKFLLVWTASLLLNSFGTQILYYNVRSWEWLREFTGMQRRHISGCATVGIAGGVAWMELSAAALLRIPHYTFRQQNHPRLGITGILMQNESRWKEN